MSVGNRPVITHGLPRRFWQDFYHYGMTATWWGFVGVIALLFLTLNGLFAGLYFLDPPAIANQNPPGFLSAFFFSVETLATVGYGDMHPQTLYGHIVATIEIFLGTMCTALVTGAVFARFSRPRARILFAESPVVGPMDGRQCLIIRAANARQNVIVDISARLRLVRAEVSVEGERIRRIHDLKLVRDQHPIFLLGWNLIHVIDESSPLFGATAESLAENASTLVLTFTGVDETTGQSMVSRHNYGHETIRWGHRYVDLFTTDADGTDHMDYRRFHDVEAV